MARGRRSGPRGGLRRPTRSGLLHRQVRTDDGKDGGWIIASFTSELERLRDSRSETFRFFRRLLETNYGFERSIAVEGDLSIGQVTLRLVEEIGTTIFVVTLLSLAARAAHFLLNMRTSFMCTVLG